MGNVILSKDGKNLYCANADKVLIILNITKYIDFSIWYEI